MSRHPQLISLALAVAGVLVAAPVREARAYGPGEALIACVSQDSAILSSILDHFASSCSVKRGTKSACAVVAGDPWVCNAKVGPTDAPVRSCLSGDGTVTMTIKVGITIPTSWTVEGTAEATLTHSANISEAKKCTADPLAAPASDGAAGTFINYAGNLQYYVKFAVKGKITVNGPGGEFIVEAGGSCTAIANTAIYREEETPACKAPVPVKPCKKSDTNSDAGSLIACEEEPLPDLPGEPVPGDPSPFPTTTTD